MNIRLFIENQEIELNESVQFAITKQFEDITNPTTIINDWSKTVSIPFSQKNNKIFGGLFNADRLTVSRDIPVDYMRTLTRSSVEAGTWDQQTGTLTSTRTTNTNPSSNWFILQNYKGDTYIGNLLVTGDLGYGSYTFTYNPTTFDSIKIKFNGNVQDCGFYLDLAGLTSGNQYTFSWYLTKLDRTSTGNEGQVTHIVLVEGSNVVTWYDIYDEQLTGIYFNPLRKLDFRLVWGDSVVMTGYAKVNEVKQSEGKGTYEITLFGQLGKVLQEMQKITFDNTTEDTEYLIDGSKYVDEYINRDLVASSWNSNGQTTPTLKKKDEDGYNVNDIIGFAPNNAFSEGFEYDTYLTTPTTSRKFTDVLGDSFKTDTGVEPDTAIPDGMTPRGIGEYRSYLQLPFIYWNKLFQVFQAKAEEVTGYKFDLDSDWFNTSNPYWYNLVYMLKSFDSKPDLLYNDNKYHNENTSRQWAIQATDYTTNYSWNITNNLTTQSEILPLYSNNRFIIPIDKTLFIRNYFKWHLINGDSSQSGREIRDNNGLLTTITATGSNGYAVSQNFLIVTNDTTGLKLDGYKTVKIIDEGWTTYSRLSVTLPIDFVISTALFGDYVTFSVSYRWYVNSQPFKNANSIIQLWLYDDIDISVYKMFKSDSNFSLNDLWNKDYDLFQQILNYCKMYRIGISVDDVNKTISFKPLVKYMQDYTITDWTNKIDKSKDYTIKPITFEDKYVLFNYDDDETKLGEEYKEKFGFNYGDYRLTTDYNFNNETNELFEGVKTSINNTDNVLSWTNLVTYHNIIYSFPAEIYVYNQDKDGKQVDIFGRFYFRNGLKYFDTQVDLHLVPPRVTDDTTLQYSTNTYFYSQGYNYAIVYTYPLLDVVYGDNMCLFNVPNQNYTYLNNYSGKGSIYTNFWQKYLDERYNTQNKVITCYVDLTPTDWTNFAFNHFVKVGNQLCIVNKIYDYDITNNETTKVDLITIQDISGYTNDNYNG